MIAALQLRAGASKVVVANNNASSGIAKGRQFERWCHADFDKATIEHDIAALQQAGRDGVVALVHAGEPCTAAALALGLVIHALVFPSSSSSSSSSLPPPSLFFSLARAWCGLLLSPCAANPKHPSRHSNTQAAYLVGAGAKSYFGCSDGWTVTEGWLPDDRWRVIKILSRARALSLAQSLSLARSLVGRDLSLSVSPTCMLTTACALNLMTASFTTTGQNTITRSGSQQASRCASRLLSIVHQAMLRKAMEMGQRC